MTDVERIAKRWYTEQRGRIVGNTVSWDDLTPTDRFNVISCVESTLTVMRGAWTR